MGPSSAITPTLTSPRPFLLREEPFLVLQLWPPDDFLHPTAKPPELTCPESFSSPPRAQTSRWPSPHLTGACSITLLNPPNPEEMPRPPVFSFHKCGD